MAAVPGHQVHQAAGAGRGGDLRRVQGDSYDNALAETVIGLYKAELITRHGLWSGTGHVEAATAWWVSWFNNRRLLRPIGGIPPAEYERNWAEGQAP